MPPALEQISKKRIKDLTREEIELLRKWYMETHSRRSIAMDRRKKARVPVFVKTWIKHPERYDLPDIDSPSTVSHPEKKDEKKDADTVKEADQNRPGEKTGSPSLKKILETIASLEHRGRMVDIAYYPVMGAFAFRYGPIRRYYVYPGKAVRKYVISTMINDSKPATIDDLYIAFRPLPDRYGLVKSMFEKLGYKPLFYERRIAFLIPLTKMKMEDAEKIIRLAKLRYDLNEYGIAVKKGRKSFVVLKPLAYELLKRLGMPDEIRVSKRRVSKYDSYVLMRYGDTWIEIKEPL